MDGDIKLATFSNMQLETFAVNAVTNAAMRYPLIPNIPIGDKGISFDGHIDVMKDASEKRDAFLGKVPVQIKGTGVKQFSGPTRSYSLELDHFRNFYKTNGAILFVVEVDDSANTKTFYKQLLPYELKILINQYGHQQTRQITLRELNGTTIDFVCHRFLNETRKQTINLIDNNPFKKQDFTSFRMSSLTFNPEKDTDIEEHDFTLYGVMGELQVPIGIIKLIGEVSEGLETLSIEGTEYKDVMVEIEINKSTNHVTFTFEKSFEIKVIDDKNFKFDIKKFISVDTQLKALPILIALLSGKKIIFKESGHVIEGAQINDPTILPKVKTLYHDFLNLREAYKILKVDLKTPFVDESTSLQKKIRLFVDVVVNNDLTNTNKDVYEDRQFYTFELGGLMFLLYKEIEPSPHLINAFSEEVISKNAILEIRDSQDKLIKKCPTSSYIKMGPTELLSFINVDLEIIFKSFEKVNPIMEAFEYINRFCLNCVTVYDETNRLEFLHLANRIYSLHTGGLQEIEEQIIRINQMQILKRISGCLSTEETRELMQMKRNASNDELIFCSSVLLGSTQEAQLSYESFPEYIKEAYLEYPIYRLYKELVL
ncbi:hypothetical protein LAV73_09375 [Lysinibacillus xylanilyticus]|uniref:hypothetical protein n=1 Tax=Lysinibacillus xylanilyticus TaxID=582475 RepID=UPI002B24FEFE|nr:hypothetical protein [Lysinibacillus xylanilyticus]MEB2280204.1 hypothetical protein [Lysinibacillus xylanilyticus]